MNRIETSRPIHVSNIVGRTISKERTKGALHACWNLYDAIGLGNMTVDMARDLAGSYGISAITAQIQFYKWRANRAAVAAVVLQGANA